MYSEQRQQVRAEKQLVDPEHLVQQHNHPEQQSETTPCASCAGTPAGRSRHPASRRPVPRRARMFSGVRQASARALRLSPSTEERQHADDAVGRQRHQRNPAQPHRHRAEQRQRADDQQNQQFQLQMLDVVATRRSPFGPACAGITHGLAAAQSTQPNCHVARITRPNTIRYQANAA